jgi:hypothetical protein
MESLCNARILGDSFIIPGTLEKCFKTLCCSSRATKKISVDNGDAFMGICAACHKRLLSKGRVDWYGWFDCSYPATARVLGSAWYYQLLALGKSNPVPVIAPSKEEPVAAAKEEPVAAAKEEPVAEAKEEPAAAKEPVLVKEEPASVAVKEVLVEVEEIQAEDPKASLMRQVEEIKTWMSGPGLTKPFFSLRVKKHRELMAIRTQLNMMK